MSYEDDPVPMQRQRYSPSAQDYIVEDNGPEAEASSEPPAPRRPLEPSILNAEPWDEVMRAISDWIHTNIQDRAHIEIEGKIGRIIDTSTGKRLVEQLPIKTETILAERYSGIRFEADMSRLHHQKFNQMLNQLHASYSKPDYPHSRIEYKHLYLVDSFYALPGGSGRDKLRVTRDQRSGNMLQCIVKQRIADLNILCPSSSADWRVSVNVEEPVHEPSPGSPELYQRLKDRMTYDHQAFRIDLTQVKTQGGPEADRAVHELEIEFAEPDELMRYAAVRGNESADGDMFDELVRIFVNNCRVMVRNL